MLGLCVRLGVGRRRLDVRDRRRINPCKLVISDYIKTRVWFFLFFLTRYTALACRVMPLLLLQSVTKTCQLGPLNSCLLLVRLSVVFPKFKPDMSSPCLITCSIFAFRINFGRVQHSKILLFQGPLKNHAQCS